MKVRWRKEEKIWKRSKLRIWGLAWIIQKRVQILGDSELLGNWMNGKWKINNQKMLDKTNLRPMADHSDLVQYVHREWHEEAVRLMHVARE